MRLFISNTFPDWFTICLNTHFDQSAGSSQRVNYLNDKNNSVEGSAPPGSTPLPCIIKTLYTPLTPMI